MHRFVRTVPLACLLFVGCYRHAIEYATPSTKGRWIAGGLPCDTHAASLFAARDFIWLQISERRIDASTRAPRYELLAGVSSPDSAPRLVRWEQAVLLREHASSTTVLFRLTDPVSAQFAANPNLALAPSRACSATPTVGYALAVLDSALVLPDSAGVTLRLDVTVSISGPDGERRESRSVRFSSARIHAFIPLV